MAHSARSNHKDRILKVLFHIQDHLDDALDLESLADMAALSPFHFHRVFKGMVGETAMEHVRRLRLERAAFSLACCRTPVTRAAFEAGYETVESFSRAFKSRFGVPPSRFAEARFSRAEDSRGELMARLTENLKEGKNMDVQIKTIDPMRIVYTRATGPYMQSAAEAWGKLMQWPGFGPAVAAPEVKFLGISHDDPGTTPPEKLRFDAAITVQGEPEVGGDIHAGEVPGGKYAVYLHVGPYEQLEAIYDNLFGKWLPASGEELRPLPGFERYLNSPQDTPPEQLKTEIWIPLA